MKTKKKWYFIVDGMLLYLLFEKKKEWSSLTHALVERKKGREEKNKSKSNFGTHEKRKQKWIKKIGNYNEMELYDFSLAKEFDGSGRDESVYGIVDLIIIIISE